MPTIRTERARVLWGPEAVFGMQSSGPYRRFGIHDTINAPDPEYAWEPFFGVFSPRSRATILRGRVTYRGSIPDIRLQSDNLSFIKDGFILGDKNTTLLRPFTLFIDYADTTGSRHLKRYYLGGKVNRFSLAANEGQELRLNIEEMLFLRLVDLRAGNDPGGQGFGDPAADPGPTAAGRFMFAHGKVTLFGLEFPRVRRFVLSGDHQIEPRYYILRDNTTMRLNPNDLIEGKRVYRLEVDMDIVDPQELELWDFFANQGASGPASPTVGGICKLEFNQTGSGEGVAQLTIQAGVNPSAVKPASVIVSAPHNIPAPPAGVVTVTATFDVDDVIIS